MGDFAREAERTAVAEAQAQNLRAELERLQRRGWLARLLNL
jgi:predicted transcriptional regulator of viral defense system